MQFDEVMVELGDSERSLGLAYVALSRVTSIEGLALSREYSYDRFDSIKRSKLYQLRQDEEDRLKAISLI